MGLDLGRSLLSPTTQDRAAGGEGAIAAFTLTSFCRRSRLEVPVSAASAVAATVAAAVVVVVVLVTIGVDIC